MTDHKSDIDTLRHDVTHILNDAQHFLRDLKGLRNVKGTVKKDVRHLRDHVNRLVAHLEELEALKLDDAASENRELRRMS